MYTKQKNGPAWHVQESQKQMNGRLRIFRDPTTPIAKKKYGGDI